MNESLRRALLRARLGEEDVAARLQVDPKTVRRWLEGRVPYPRHRWLLASALGLDEADLWPQFAAARSWPQEVQAIYPHCGDMPRETWRSLLDNARERIDILAGHALPFAIDQDILTILASQAAAGIAERICLGDPEIFDMGSQVSRMTSIRRTKEVLAWFSSLRLGGDVEVRLHHTNLTNFIYRSDDECLITQKIHGISSSRRPVMHLRRTRYNDLFESYIKSFEDVWASARLC